MVLVTTGHSVLKYGLYNCLIAVIQLVSQQPQFMENWRILLDQSFTTRVTLLTATIAIGLGRRC